LLGARIVAAVERQAPLLIRRQPKAGEPRRLLGAGRAAMQHQQEDDPWHRRAAAEPQEAERRARQQQPKTLVAPARARLVGLCGLKTGFDAARQRTDVAV